MLFSTGQYRDTATCVNKPAVKSSVRAILVAVMFGGSASQHSLARVS